MSLVEKLDDPYTDISKAYARLDRARQTLAGHDTRRMAEAVAEVIG